MKKLVILAARATIIFAAFVVSRQQKIDLETVRGHVDALAAWRASNATTLVVWFFAAYVPIAAPCLQVAIWMTLAVGALFGFWQGVLIVSFASILGATLAFLAARYLFRDWVRERLEERTRVLYAGLARDGAFYLFALRLILVIPFFAVNLLMGLTPVPTLTFNLVSQAGMLAGTAVYVNAGTQLALIENLSGIVSPSLILSFALLGIFPLVARMIEQLQKGRPEDGRLNVGEHR